MLAVDIGDSYRQEKQLGESFECCSSQQEEVCEV